MIRQLMITFSLLTLIVSTQCFSSARSGLTIGLTAGDDMTSGSGTMQGDSYDTSAHSIHTGITLGAQLALDPMLSMGIEGGLGLLGGVKLTDSDHGDPTLGYSSAALRVNFFPTTQQFNIFAKSGIAFLYRAKVMFSDDAINLSKQQAPLFALGIGMSYGHFGYDIQYQYIAIGKLDYTKRTSTGIEHTDTPATFNGHLQSILLGVHYNFG